MAVDDRIAVIGSGLMGAGIAQVALEAGFDVLLCDTSTAALDGGVGRIRRGMEKSASKGRIDASLVERLDTTLHTEATATVPETWQPAYVIEAIIENLAAKLELFRTLTPALPVETVVLSNTSALSISQLSGAVAHPERFAGLHFFYPAPLMPLVEATIPLTAAATLEGHVSDLAQKLSKQLVRSADTPGFLVNRMLVPMMNEAAFLVMEGASPEDVDRAMKLGANHPMGPLQLADFVGLDVVLATMESLYEGFSDSKYRPCPLLRQLVNCRRLGRKTGEGFFKYGD